MPRVATIGRLHAPKAAAEWKGWSMRTILRGLVLAAVCTSSVACGGSGVSSAPGSTTANATASPGPAVASGSPAAVVSSAPSRTPIPGCLPQCWIGRLERPGPISGDYTTTNFFGGGMTVPVPDGWVGFEDSTGELALGPADSEDFRVEFWIDVYAAKDASGAPGDVPITTTAMTDWMASNPNLEILGRVPTTWGPLKADVFDWTRAAKAVNTDPDCPTELQPCIVEFGYPEWDGAYNEGGPFRDRLFVAPATWGGQPHTVYAMITGNDAAAFAKYEAAATAMVAGTQLPAGVGP